MKPYIRKSKIISIYFRQLKKNKNKIKTLNKEANQKDMKKLFVNAQVTATISLIEMGTNVLHTTLLKYYRGTNFYNLLQSMIVYDIVLPYAFLMNTSHNKKRIVESGWKNVLKNIMGQKGNAVESQHEISNDISSKQNVVLKESIKTELTGSNEMHTTDTTFGSLSTNAADHSFTANPRLHETHPTSKHLDIKRRDFGRLSINGLLEQGQYQDVVRRQVLDMRNFENDENVYLRYFRRLVSFQDQRKKGIVLSCLDLDDESVPTYRKCKKSKNSHRNTRKQGVDIAMYRFDVKTDNMVDNYKFTGDDDINLTKVSFKGTVNERNLKREKLLEEINNAADDEQDCDILIERLIQVEENFVLEN